MISKDKKIDMCEIDDINATQSLGEFLCKLNINSADKLLEECDNNLTENFCSECEYRKSNCECREDDYGGRYMREYDDGADYED
jgi:hypothetical protein